MSDFQDKITGANPQPRQSDAQDRERVRESQDNITGVPPRQADSLSEAHSLGTTRIEYALTLEDAVAFFRYDVKHNPRASLWARSLAGIPPWVWLVLVGMTLTMGVLIRLMLPRMPSFDLFDGLMVIVLAWLLFRVIFGDRLRVRRALQAVQRNPRFFQPYTMTISPEGLNWTGASDGGTTPWQAIFAIVTHGEHAFFYKTDRKTTILPQRAFADRRQFEKFVDTARSYHAEACHFVRTEGQA